jgi:hypothetical protein
MLAHTIYKTFNTKQRREFVRITETFRQPSTNPVWSRAWPGLGHAHHGWRVDK